jgi:hypothetical protein
MELTADILEEFISWQARGKLPDLSAQAFLDEKDRERLITNAGNVVNCIDTGVYWDMPEVEVIVNPDSSSDDVENALTGLFDMIKADLMEGVTGSV